MTIDECCQPRRGEESPSKAGLYTVKQNVSIETKEELISVDSDASVKGEVIQLPCAMELGTSEGHTETENKDENANREKRQTRNKNKKN